MRIVNLTGEAITMERDGDITTLHPEERVATVATERGHPLASDGLPCLLRAADLPGEVRGLPPPRVDTIYLVTRNVAEVCGRADCFCVDDWSDDPAWCLVQAPLD